MPQPITAECLTGVSHGFFTRHGGVSQGLYASLNCGLGSNDDAAAVRENRARVAARLGARALITAHQIHSASAVVVQDALAEADRPRADAIVTATPGIAVGVLAADCAPVLFADARAKVIGAAHAGWRGAIGGVLEATVSAMEGLGALRTHTRAVVGPCIGPSAYEVGFDFKQQFLEQDPASLGFFVEPELGGRPHFDLAGYVVNRLSRAGLSQIGTIGACTFAGRRDFFSFRRSQACREADYGRQISAIVLT
ncbi:MAG: peptidoglycan editing factor PgeF [Hyphomicrobiaceae bacterium]|nr:MAG: peptidoglycan editing factor PgeF [Hyphomicrobiaceae bacterium]